MTLFTRIKNRAQAWHKDENGSVAVETILMVPLLAWAMLATLTYFDAYRNESISYKTGLTIADAISREAEVDDDYIDGIYGLHQFLMLKDKSPDLRITVYDYDPNADEFRTVWSKSRGTQPELTTATLNSMSGKLPNMSPVEHAILVETWSDYEAPYSVGLGEFDMSSYNVISPRFTLKLCFDNSPGDGDDSSQEC